MTIEVYYDKENDCVIGSITGAVNLQTLTEYAQQVAEILVQYDCQRLITDLQRGEHDISTADLRELPDIYENIMSQEKITKRSLKRATVVPKDPKSFGHAVYYEVESQNQGHFERVFTDMDDAMTWLKSSSP